MKEAIRLSVRYLPDAFLPDKAIDLLDEAASRVRLGDIGSRMAGRQQELEQPLPEWDIFIAVPPLRHQCYGTWLQSSFHQPSPYPEQGFGTRFPGTEQRRRRHCRFFL